MHMQINIAYTMNSIDIGFTGKCIVSIQCTPVNFAQFNLRIGFQANGTGVVGAKVISSIFSKSGRSFQYKLLIAQVPSSRH